MNKRFKKLIPMMLGVSMLGATVSLQSAKAAGTVAETYQQMCADLVNSLPKSSKGNVLAEINGQPVTEADLLTQMGPKINQTAEAMKASLAKQLGTMQAAAFNDLISTRLLQEEAKKQGISVEALLKKEVADKLPAPTDDEIQAYYTANQAKMGGKPLDQVKDQIISLLKLQREGAIKTKFMGSLMASHKVEKFVDFTTRVKVGVGQSPSKGSEKATVTIVEFTDYECPFCSRAVATVKQVMDTYKDDVRVVVRNFPLGFHKNAQKAAEAALCAHAQGKYWEYSDKMWANQKALSVDNLKSYASEFGLDVPAFSSCLDSGKMEAEVKQDAQEGAAVGVTGTPAFFINGRMLSGAQPFEEFKKVIDEELMNKKPVH